MHLKSALLHRIIIQIPRLAEAVPREWSKNGRFEERVLKFFLQVRERPRRGNGMLKFFFFSFTLLV